jgi:hypothetical protein
MTALSCALSHDFPQAAGLEASGSEYVLELAGRGVTALGGVLAGYPSLRSVNVSFNRLTRLDGLLKLPDLRELKAFDNALTTTQGLEGCVAIDHWAGCDLTDQVKGQRACRVVLRAV